MFKQVTTISIIVVMLIVSLANCSGGKNAAMEATVQAGVAATQTAEAGMQAAISDAVAATLTAMPTPTPLAVDQLSEEELADAVESSANEAVTTCDQASAASDSASSDGEITDEELQELYYLYYLAIDEAEQAMALAEDYYDLYAELLESTITELEDIEAQLQEIEDTANEVLAVLNDISQTLQQGGEVAQQSIENLQQLSQQAAQNASAVQERLPGWKETRVQETDRLAEQALAVAPNEIAETRAGALTQAREYIQTVQSAASDGRFSSDELAAISQLGANAAASLSRFGGGDLAGLPDAINGLTRSFARGQMPEVNRGLGSLQNSLPSIR